MGDLDIVYNNLRACLISCKDGIPLNDLENEYFKLNGEQTAYRRYGFTSLEDLLRSSDKFTIQNRGGIIIVQASTTQKTQHLIDLIKKQKPKPFKKIQSNTVSQININDKDENQGNNIYTMEKNSEFKHIPQQQQDQQQPLAIFKYPSTNMALKPPTAQSRLQKYPKKCDETLNKVDEGVKNLTVEGSIQSIKVEDDLCLEVYDNNDYISELESYLKNLNLPEPYYDCLIKKEKHDKTIRLIHTCTVKVIDKSSSSYPVECKTMDCAKQVAAKKIIAILKTRYGENMVYPITIDINMMAVRIKEFLKSGFERNGLISDKLEEKYREKFQENLPHNWVQLLEDYSYFTFDKLIANKIIVYLNEMDSDYCQNSQANINEYLDEALVEGQNIIPGTPLTFEDYEEKSVLVSANYGATNIWIRFVGQSADENFIQMQAKFNDTMNTTGVSIAEQVTEGEYYAVLYNSTWHRVQISSPIGEDGTVACFMVDTGELYNISKDQICNLEPVFMKTKLQAIECILTQFDNFGTFDGLRELLNEMILNKTFIVVPDSLEDSFRVTLYGKGETSDRINVNNMIIQRFLEKTVVKLPSFEEHTVVDGIVSSFVESGHLYLQLNFDIISTLEEILPNDECFGPEYFLKNKEDIGVDQVYLMKYEDNNLWCRVQVIEIINDSEVKVIYIDYGNITKCEINKLVNLKLFDPLMAMISPQALKVSMNLLPPSIMTSDIAKKLFDIIGNDKVLVNVINAPINDVPCVQLYKTESTEETASCINIQMAISLKKQK